MDGLIGASAEALRLLFTGDREIWEIVAISFSVSFRAILYIVPLAILSAFALAYGNFPGRRALITVVNSLVALPAVVVGLLLYMLLSSSGPFGGWRLLFTQGAMIIGQMILAFPLLVAMIHVSLQGVDLSAWQTARTLGAGIFRAMLTIMREVRFGLIAAIVAGFGRVVSEVGCSIMVGGNILHHTRNIPTAIALETSKGEFEQGIALGAVLITLALALNFAVATVRGRDMARH
ncbi:MAG: ABC transporter permease [Gammaproteobacteria bacterium]|nr:ABC transporter permease [Gammaproteobacteria bacterium]